MRIEVEIVNELGLHARPAAEFVRAANKFKETTIVLHKDGETFSCTSILDVLSANLDCGAQLALEAHGPQEDEALRVLAALLLEFREQEEREKQHQR